MRGHLLVARIAATAAVLSVMGACGAADPGELRAAPPPVVSADDAVQPQEGRDYRLVRTLRNRDAHRAAGVTGSGEVLLTWYTGFQDHVHHALLDPRTGHRTPLPDLGPVSEVVEVSRTRAVLVTPAPGPPVRVVFWNRDSGRERGFTLPEVRGRLYRVLDVEGDRVWFRTGPAGEHDAPDHVWSVRFGRPGTLQHLGWFAAPAVADGVLAHAVRRSGGAPDAVTMRDLTGGPATRVPLPDGCSVESPSTSVETNGEQASVDAYCGDHETTFVVDRTDGLVADLRVESDEGNLQTSDRAVSFYWYAYDLLTGRLLDVSDRARLTGTPPSAGPGDRPLMIWPRGTDDHDRPGRVLVVRLK
jgi:hypothetical protein